MERKDQLVSAIKDWVTLDNKMSILQKELKILRKQKKDMTSGLVDVMRNNEIDAFNINGGSLCYSKTQSKAPLTKKSLMDILLLYFKDQPEKGNELYEFINENRGEVVRENVRRKIEKEKDN